MRDITEILTRALGLADAVEEGEDDKGGDQGSGVRDEE
jgi:hypothetical protein